MQSQTFSFNSLKISRFPKNEKPLDSCILIWKEYFDDYQIKTKYLTYKAYELIIGIKLSNESVKRGLP